MWSSGSSFSSPGLAWSVASSPCVWAPRRLGSIRQSRRHSRLSNESMHRKTKASTEEMMSKNLAISYDIYIGAAAAKVWKGIVDGEMTRHYVYGTRLESKLKKGTSYAYV